MFCTQCGTQLGERDRFCSQCAHPTEIGAPVARPRVALALDKQNKKLAGVCAGFARYLDVDVTLVRIVWLALALGAGVGFIGYVVAWIIMPKEQRPLCLPRGQYARAAM